MYGSSRLSLITPAARTRCSFSANLRVRRRGGARAGRPPGRATGPSADLADCLGAVGDVELGEDRAHVMVDRVRADDQTAGDLGVRQPFADQPDDIDLSAGEAVRVL